MIVRIWRGRADSLKSGTYVEHFTQSVLPDLRTIKGFLGASLLRQNRSSEVEFLVLTKWSSMDAIRAFAGNDVRKAVVRPEAVAALTSFDATVEHYEAVEDVLNS